MRIAMSLEYDGSAYNGWQRQIDGLAVQTVVETAITTVADHPVSVVCAGRTDAGVHATEQIIHFDTDAQRSRRSWVFGCNANLPSTVAVQWAQPVDKDFHARFSAEQRSYRYILYNHPVRSPLTRCYATWWCQPLQLESMQAAATAFLGEHDFSAVRAAGCQAKSPVRTVHSLQLQQLGDYIYLDISANAFLQHMVRNIVGILLAIGLGDRPIAWAAEVIAQRDRTIAGITAPGNGLYLTQVKYPKKYAIPARNNLPTLS